MRTHNLAKTRAILTPAMQLALKDQSETFYAELDQEFGQFKGHVLISQHDFDEAWPTWEIHPKGDELVMLLSGDTELVLSVDGKEQTTRLSEPGDYVVVPRNTWHTARPYAPCTMLFVTPGEGTLNAEEPGAV